MATKINVPDRPTVRVRLTLAVVGLALLIYAWFRAFQWAGR